MNLINFTRNYTDLSTNLGYQFKFFCDRCQNGYLSPYEASTTGLAGAVVRTAGQLVGGLIAKAGAYSGQVERLLAGPAHDAALRRAVTAAQEQFRRCSRCTMWVCPETCWNQQKALCQSCAPETQVEKAAAQAHAARDQVWRAAQQVDYAKNAAVQEETLAACPKCGHKAEGSRFCSKCGGPLYRSVTCSGCKSALRPDMTFCPECGRKCEVR